MTQKIVRVGNSAAITIPSKFLKNTNLKIGDEVYVEEDSDLKVMIVKPKQARDVMSLTPEFRNWFETFMKENKETL